MEFSETEFDELKTKITEDNDIVQNCTERIVKYKRQLEALEEELKNTSPENDTLLDMLGDDIEAKQLHIKKAEWTIKCHEPLENDKKRYRMLEVEIKALAVFVKEAQEKKTDAEEQKTRALVALEKRLKELQIEQGIDAESEATG